MSTDVGRAAPSARVARSWTLLATGVVALVIIPFALFGTAMDRWSVHAVESMSARPAVSSFLIVVLLASDVVLPVPSSVVSTLSGVWLGVVPGTLASFTGMSLGCLIGYFVGRTGGRGVARRTVGDMELRRLRDAAARYGVWSLALVRAVPVLAEASVVFAGMGAMSIGRFVAITTLSNLGISLVYAATGAYAAELQSFLLAVAAALLVPALVFAACRLLPQ